MMGLANTNLNRTFTLAEAGRGLSPFTEERGTEAPLAGEVPHSI
jgi:hypothetical protein